MRKQTICICKKTNNLHMQKNKDTDQLCSNCTANQRLCFCHMDSTIPLLLFSEVASFLLFSETVQGGLCRTWSETPMLVFSHTGSFVAAEIFGGACKGILCDFGKLGYK